MSNDLFAFSQFRLTELSVCNWGSFDGIHTAHIDAEGTLITGDNGAGKSTLIDGLMALLVPAGKASFNMAASQGDKSDRNLLSYMQGSFGSDYDGADSKLKSKRTGATCSALRALYTADDGQKVSLCSIFWTTQATNQLADVKRLNLVAKRDLTLTEIFQHFNQGQVRALKQLFKQDQDIICCEEKFSAYETYFREILHLHNKNAPALLQRALGLKQIKDLTGLIRDLVLEASEIRDDVRKIVMGFDDLKVTHAQLEDARDQQECLQALPELKVKIANLSEQAEQLIAEKNAIRAYIAEQAVELFEQKLTELDQIKEQLEKNLHEAEEAIALLGQQKNEAYANYMQVGGSQVESLRRDLEFEHLNQDRILQNFKQYQNYTLKLGLDSQLDFALFQQYQSQADDKIKFLIDQEQQLEEQKVKNAVEYSKNEDELQQCKDELRVIESRPDSMIAPHYQQLRNRLCDQLNLNNDELIFIGELIDVQDQQKSWQGAIERALGGLRNTLLVAEKSFRQVTQWLNQNHVGLHIRVQVVMDHALQKEKHSPEFWQDGFLLKLQWRPHPYREWLKAHLKQFDLHCVEDKAQLDQTPFSMTIQGLVQMERGRFEKKDQKRIDDQSTWQLGFSNTQRLNLAKEKLQHLQLRYTELDVEKSRFKNEIAMTKLHSGCWTALSEMQWENINVQACIDRITEIEQHIQRIEADEGDLARAKHYWMELENKYTLQNKHVKELATQSGQLSTKLQQLQSSRDAQQLCVTDLHEAVKTALAKQIGILQLEDLTKLSEIENQHRQQYEQRIEDKQNTKSNRINDVTGIINRFKAKWLTISAEWGNKYDAIDEYLTYFEQLMNEGLPELEAQFKERLTKHASQSLLGIRTRLDAEKKDILDKINTINQVLARTEFREGSYLKLMAADEHFPKVKQFRKDLDYISSLYTSTDYELLYKQLHKIIAELAVASDPATWQNKDSLRLLDPRYQLSFRAEEVDIETQTIIDVWADSSGKSGGEKEAFAGTIVAASLAYVLTPEGQDYPVYSTIFLDEAFSNTSEVVSKRVLKVFKALHLHINLITPFKNLNLARESARSLIIAERDVKSHESTLSEITWQQLDEQYLQSTPSHIFEDIEISSLGS